MVNNLLLLVSCFLSSYSASDDLIRLAGSNEPCSGRVEIYHNGVWGTVCDDGWDLNDAAVACRQLGCGPAEKALTLAHFGQGTGQIWLDDVVCSGNEPSLAVCGHREFGTHDCGHHEDAGVNCSMSLPKPTITIQPTGLIMWGQDVHITCSITGGEVGGSFIFTKTPGSFTQTVDSSSSSTILHLHQVNFTNEGSYQCQFQRTDSSSVFSDYVNLKVTVILPKPSIAMDPAGVVTFGDLIAINCSISTQYLGGSFTLQKTSGSFTKTQQSSTNSSTFRFLEANDNHVGDYRCYYETLVEYKTFTSPLSDNVTVSVTYD